LERTDGRYRNTAPASHYLVEGRPAYLGGFTELAGGVQWDSWGRFTRALRTGEHQDDSPMDDGTEMFRTHAGEDPDRILRIMTAMDSHSTRAAAELAARVNWDEHKTFADLGGARGNLAARLAEAVPHVTGVCLDRPPAEPFFADHVGALGMLDRVRFVGGDFFADDLPEADVYVYGHVLNNWDPQTRRLLVERAYDALPPGGLLLVYDRMIDDDRPDLFVLSLSLTFMLTSPGGSEYRVQECQAWMRDAGFADSWAEPILEDHVLVTGRK
jgi:hypothetical protein